MPWKRLNPALQSALSITLLMTLTLAARAEQTIESGPSRVALLELYTSEGCSSCPPADRWLSSLEAKSGLWNDYVPIAFHVDYWDYIGWEDRFADSSYSSRQRQYAREGGVNVVYTPGLVLNGEEWRRWRFAGEPGNQGADDAGTLKIVVDDDNVRVEYASTATAHAQLVANVAWLGFDLTSAVDAGENRGRQLTHDFVVLNLSDIRMQRQGDRYVAIFDRPADLIDAPRMGIAAWVSPGKTQAPLQAAGGLLSADAELQAALPST